MSFQNVFLRRHCHTECQSVWNAKFYFICGERLSKMPLICIQLFYWFCPERAGDWKPILHQENMPIYNFDPLKPHFYVVKLGFTGVYILFLIFAQKYRLWVLVRTILLRQFYWVSTIYVLSKNMKNIGVFYLKVFSFWRWNLLCYWIGMFS